MFRPEDYEFELPPELIAQIPAAARDASRLLVVEPDGALRDHTFTDLLAQLPPHAVLILNDTRVIKARMFATRPSGGTLELLVLEPAANAQAPVGHTAWRALAKASGKVRVGDTASIGGETLTILAERGADAILVLAIPGDPFAFLERHGELPLPPYIERAAGRRDPLDDERYQTVVATEPGAVAAPTAGLHFTPALLAAIVAAGHDVTTITLHVGWGTFAPIRADDIREHRMHRERYVISARTAELVASGRPMVVVGTTALRALEAAATGPRQVAVGPGSTDIFIHPGSGRRFLIADYLVTNFHLPRSTLLMLVSAFAGPARIRAAYAHAVAARYRFFSYGDAMLLQRLESPT